MPEELWRCFVETPVGAAQVVSSGVGIRGVGFVQPGGPPDPRLDRLGSACVRPGDPHGLAERVRAWFDGDRAAFDAVPLDLEGTPFQRQVWHHLRQLPVGQTSTYGRLAIEVGRPAAARAVGAAIGRNPAALLVPCHRVLGVGGRLTGYAWGLPRKRWLLRHEGVLPAALPLARFGT